MMYLCHPTYDETLFLGRDLLAANKQILQPLEVGSCQLYSTVKSIKDRKDSVSQENELADQPTKVTQLLVLEE